MKVVKNENEQPQQKREQMSDFCEALIQAMETKLSKNDCALMICADGNKVGARMHGNYPHLVNVISTVMKNDERFAELIIEASVLYSRHLVRNAEDKNGMHVLKKQDNPNLN